MSRRLIRLAELATTKNRKGKVPFSPATVWRLSSEGKFPKPFKLSDSITVWDEDQVDDYIAKCAEAAAPTSESGT